MDEMYKIGCKISKPSTGYYVVPLDDLIVYVVGLLQSLNMNFSCKSINLFY